VSAVWSVEALTKQLVEIDSQNPGAFESEIADFVAAELRTSGFEVEVVREHPDHPNVIARASAGGSRFVGLSGHLDTKPTGDAISRWTTPPLELTKVGDEFRGLGVADMKAAVSAMMIAATDWIGRARHGGVELILTADEEAGGRYGSLHLAQSGRLRSEAVVIGEPSGVAKSWEWIHTVSRGIHAFTLHVTTQQGHSGLSTRLRPSATLVAAELALRLAELAPPLPEATDDIAGWEATMNSAVAISGGVGFGVHPGHASVRCEIRTVPGMSRSDLVATVRDAIDDYGRSLDAEVDIEIAEPPLDWYPAVEISPEHPLVAACRASAKAVLGHEPPLGAYPGGTDAGWLTSIAGIPCVASLGPGCLTVAHGPNESIAGAALGQAVDIFGGVLDRYWTTEGDAVE
jgi:acetylornithine deacetylase/succinyl-diaminopimelate desuccinylase-like protein